MTEQAIVIHQPNTAEISENTSDLVRQIRELEITDQASFELMCELGKGCGAVEAEIDALFDEPRELAHKTWKSIIAIRDGLKKPVVAGRNLAKGKARDWLTEQKRIAAAEQRRLEAEAKAAEEARILEDAIAAEENGNQGEAEAILNEADEIVAPVIPIASVAKVAGVSERRVITGTVHDEVAFLGWLMEHPDRIRECIDWRQSGLNAVAKAVGEAGAPGLTVNDNSDISLARS